MSRDEPAEPPVGALAEAVGLARDLYEVALKLGSQVEPLGKEIERLQLESALNRNSLEKCEEELRTIAHALDCDPAKVAEAVQGLLETAQGLRKEVEEGKKYAAGLRRQLDQLQGAQQASMIRGMEVARSMRVGTPSAEAIRAHGGPWIVQLPGQYPHVVDARFLREKADSCRGEFRCWPCDEDGNRVPWPRGADGREL